MNSKTRSTAFLLAGLFAGLGLSQGGAAADASAADLAALEARLAALERALVVSADGVTLSSARASITLNAAGNISVRGSRSIEVLAGDAVAIEAGRAASLRMAKNGSVLLRGGPIDLISSSDVQIRATRNLALKGSKIADN